MPSETTTGAVPATADLYDAHGENLQSCDLQLQGYGAIDAFCGPIATVKCFEDNVLVKAAVGEAGAGRVLVVDGAGSLHVALLGDKMAKIALDNGWAGVIINGAVRDVTILAELRIGIKALGSNPRKSAKRGIGERDVPVQFGGVTFSPGDTLYADADGVVTLSADVDA
jgi:regulator of ribonuclease activity A